MTEEAQLNIIDRTPLDMLASRRSVLAARLAEPGPDEKELARMLDVAVRVPDHGRVTPWRLQVLTRQAQKELGDAFAEEFTRQNPGVPEDRLHLEWIRPQRSPVLVIVSSRIVPDREGVPPVEQLLSCGNVCFNLLHAATALGYGGPVGHQLAGLQREHQGGARHSARRPPGRLRPYRHPEGSSPGTPAPGDHRRGLPPRQSSLTSLPATPRAARRLQGIPPQSPAGVIPQRISWQEIHCQNFGDCTLG